jgi:hypothetical protein
MALVLTPLIYLIENRIENYFGKDVTKQMKASAMGNE